MGKPLTSDGQVHLAVIKQLLDNDAYRPLAKYLTEKTNWNNKELINTLRLGQAYLDIDLTTIEELAPRLGRHYLLKPSYLKRRVYSFAHYMHIQYKRKEYMDYFRAMTPLLVDLLRLVIEHNFMPDLNMYIQPIIKENDLGTSIYKGLQWQQDKIEAKPNLVQETFTKYYGDRFNYKHYVSSSHLLKIITDHSNNDTLITKCDKLRHIEKNVRNIVAHEVVHVTERFVKHRTDLTIEEIHQLIVEVMHIANLKDQRQWEIMENIKSTIKTKITEKIN